MAGDQFDVDVLYHQGGVLALSKPPGLAMHAGTGVDDEETLAYAIRESFDIEEGFSGPSFIGRLDRATSGLVLCALDRQSLNTLNDVVTNGNPAKEYLCIVHGRTAAEGTIDVPLAARRPRHRGSGRVEAAVTHYRRLSTTNRDCSLLLVRLGTGRTHQIRRHMKAIQHPILGDTRYGHRRRDDSIKGLRRSHGLQLHAFRFRQSHSSRLPDVLTAPPPTSMRRLSSSLELPLVDV